MMSKLAGHHQGLAQSLICVVRFVMGEDLHGENDRHSWESERGIN